MEPWLIAIALKPLVLLAMFGLVVIPIELFLRPHLPALFTDRTFMQREPAKYVVVWLSLMIGLWYFIFSLVSSSR